MKKHVTTSVSLIAILAVITFAAFKSFDFKSSAQSQIENSTTQLPPIISKINSLEIVNVKIINAGSPDEMARIDLKNNSPKPIVAAAIESGDEKDTSGIIRSGFVKEPPRIIAPPFEVFTLEFPLSDVIRDLPIRISGVMYADDSEDGEEKAVNDIREHKIEMANRIKGKIE